jgi:tripeptidyl-peptidase-1
VVLGGSPQWNGGTSASTPTFAGIVSLLNDHRFNNGKKQLGFLNFLLYEMGVKYPQAFHYITQGNNSCTGWEMGTCCKYGYSAIAGWNPTVGFGTPNFAAMVDYIDKLK